MSDILVDPAIPELPATGKPVEAVIVTISAPSPISGSPPRLTPMLQEFPFLRVFARAALRGLVNAYLVPGLGHALEELWDGWVAEVPEEFARIDEIQRLTLLPGPVLQSELGQ